MRFTLAVTALSAFALGLGLGPLAAPATAAEWFQLGSRALPRGESPAPDAPVLGVAYGPRASSRLGADLAVATWRRDTRTLRLGFAALVGFDNAVTRLPLAGEVGRTATEIGLAWSFDALATRRLGPRGTFELALALGRRTAFATERYILVDPYRTDDVPFGAGGTYLGVDALARVPIRAAGDLTLRLGLRSYLNGLADTVGAREISDVIADYLHEGAEWQTSIEIGVGWRFRETARMFAALYSEVIGPHDDTAKRLWLARLEIGTAFAAHAFDVCPFVDLEAGHAPSLLVNRTELRAALGVKVYAH